MTKRRRLEGGQWLYAEHRDGAVELLSGKVQLRTIYDKIDFSASEEE